MQPAAFLELQRVGGLGDHQHIAAQLAAFHLAGDLGLQGARAALEEFDFGVGELGLERFAHHVADVLIHGGVDDNFAGDVGIFRRCAGNAAQHQEG